MVEEIHNCPVCSNPVFSDFLKVKDYFLTKEVFTIQKCDACGFKFINPRPDKFKIGQYYQSDEYISHDAKKENLISRIYKIARRFSIKTKFSIVSEYGHKGKILDIGCGTGEFLQYCKSSGFDVYGVEPSEKARVFAQQVNKISVTDKLSDYGNAQHSFNCISMWHVLEHVHDLNETLEMVKALLKPDGVFIVAVPNCNSWDAQHYGNFWAAYDVPRHLYHFTDITLTKLVSKHGFIIRKLLPQKLDAFYVAMLSEKYRTGKINYFKFLILGLWSNFQSGKQKRGHSSQIFVLSLKKS
ncbi:MAG: class I SAM-dependent methyltransferase [Bacteroidota bacterium]